MQGEIPSKTKKKQEMHELQALGAALVELSEAHFGRMALPVELAQAVLEARRIRSHEAKRRQVQFIGRLMRGLDAEPIRARLLEDEGALTEFAREHAAADLQQLRALIRNARREQAASKPPRAYRELFRVIREAADE